MIESIEKYNDFFEDIDYRKILDEVSKPRWQFGHGSYHSSDPRSKKGYPFWVMGLEDNLFFTDHLLNIIKEKTNRDYELYDVYANGHTFGTKGSFHIDWNDDRGRTFLFYANDVWDVDWGGKTMFDLGGDYYCHIPKPNSALLFPGMIPHAAEGPTRSFIGLRITIAWKLLLK
jgi:hypothetical protein